MNLTRQVLPGRPAILLQPAFERRPNGPGRSDTDKQHQIGTAGRKDGAGHVRMFHSIVGDNGQFRCRVASSIAAGLGSLAQLMGNKLHGVHVDAGVARCDMHRGPHTSRLAEHQGQAGDKLPRTVRHPAPDVHGIAADAVHVDVRGRPVQRPGDVDQVVRSESVGHVLDRRNGQPPLHDRHAEARRNLGADRGQTTGHLGDSLVNRLAHSVQVTFAAVGDLYAERHGPHFQRRLDDLFQL